MPDGLSRRQFLARGGTAVLLTTAVSSPGETSVQRASRVSAETPAEERFAELSSRIPDLMEQAAVPGLSIAVIRDARLVWAHGFGVKRAATNEAVRTDTVFEAASLSKPLFAYAILQLCEKGSLALDTPLTDYLPDPYLPDEPRLPLITARKVLSHTTGFPNWRPRDSPLTINFTPGERFSYSGEGYVYLQRVLERLAGQSL